MSEPMPAAVTEDELADQCQHVCLKPDGHVSPHFYGYRLGPWSQEWLVAEVRRLRAERAVMLDVIEAARRLTESADTSVTGLRVDPHAWDESAAALVRFDELSGDDL